MGVLLMIPNNFRNIWIFVQTFHEKLSNALLFFLIGMLKITTAILWSKIAMIPTCIHKTMVLGWLCCIHIHPHFMFLYEHALFTNDDEGDFQWLAFSSQLLVDHTGTIWISKEYLCYFSFFQCILLCLPMVCNVP